MTSQPLKRKPVAHAVVLGSFILCCFAAAAFAQEAAAPKAQTKTLWEIILEGGWIMIPIALCSVFTFYLVVDGILRTGRKKSIPEQHLEALKGLFRQGDYGNAYQYCKSNPSPITNVIRVGLSMLGEGKDMTEVAMGEELSKENSKLQTRLSYLSVIGVCAPMIGLTGTVTGMMRAFSTLASSGIGDPSKLSGAIGEVLVATASGLIIAIPAFGFFYYLRARAAAMVHDIGDTVNLLFRKMPYAELEGAHYGDEEIFAAIPGTMPAFDTGVVQCPNCSGEVPAGAAQCPHCGQAIAWE
ncbi:MAG: MotA/TolQ/ExbB proton channel family protein [Chthoniobacterales bacterium]